MERELERRWKVSLNKDGERIGAEMEREVGRDEERAEMERELEQRWIENWNRNEERA
jgi:hypothetical protein